MKLLSVSPTNLVFNGFKLDLMFLLMKSLNASKSYKEFKEFPQIPHDRNPTDH
jgi:hypothetical protein